MRTASALISGSIVTGNSGRSLLRMLLSVVGACVLTLPMTSSAGDLHARVLDQNGWPVEDAVVAAKTLTVAGAMQVIPSDEVVDQIDKEFVPHVKPILVGSRVNFPNKDNVRHEVYSFSAAKKFQLPLYSGTTAPPVLFDKAGIVVLGCNIHDWMVAYIYVADTAYSGKTAKEGTVVLKDIPPGDYNVRVWQPSMSEAEDATIKRVAIAKSGSTEVEWRITLKPAFKVRRAPSAGRGSYR